MTPKYPSSPQQYIINQSSINELKSGDDANKERKKMHLKHKKKCSISLTVKEILNKSKIQFLI